LPLSAFLRLPGDISSEWNGSFKGMPALEETYVYMITLILAGEEQQIYKGTIILCDDESHTFLIQLLLSST